MFKLQKLVIFVNKNTKLLQNCLGTFVDVFWQSYGCLPKLDI